MVYNPHSSMDSMYVVPSYRFIRVRGHPRSDSTLRSVLFLPHIKFQQRPLHDCVRGACLFRINRLIWKLKCFINGFHCLENKVIPLCLLVLLILGGMVVSPIGQQPSWLPSDPVPVDAIPDIGENQQIVFTQWAGNSPQDIEDQITHPLTSALLGIPGVKSIRSSSIFGMSSIYIIFDEDVEFYWSRSRILEKLNALPRGLLPFGVTPTLGPDATALGQVFWYTLEGRDSDGNPTGGWDLHELRTIQDFQVKYASCVSCLRASLVVMFRSIK